MVSRVKTAPHIVAATLKEEQALGHRLSGMKFSDIARAVGYANASGAYKAVVRALDKTIREPAEKLREVEEERLNAILEELWERRGDEKVTAQILRVMERRARLLGLDAPERHEVGVSGEFEKRLAELDSPAAD